MKWTFIIFSLVFISCTERNESVESKDVSVYHFTDSILFEEEGLKVMFDSQELFDTTYKYVFQSCVYNTAGYHCLDTTYEKVIPWWSNWNPIQMDSMLSLRIHCGYTYHPEKANFQEVETMYAQNKAASMATRSSYSPTFGNTEKIHKQDFAFLCTKDTIRRDSSTFYSVDMTARTFIDTTQITFQFSRYSQKQDPIELQFLEILRSVKIEKIQ